MGRRNRTRSARMLRGIVESPVGESIRYETYRTVDDIAWLACLVGTPASDKLQ